MRGLLRGWNHLEEGLVALLLTAMTLVTFCYVVVNNLFGVCYDLADTLPWLETPLLALGDALLGLAQEMTWSAALTRACFAWLIFLGIAYGVRIGAHIGVDLLVRLLPRPLQRGCGVLACLICLGYAGLMMVSSYDWVMALYRAAIGAEDLDEFGILQWQIAAVVPLGFGLVLLRLIEVLVNIARGRQLGLDTSDEAADALRLAAHDDVDEETRR